MEVLVTRKKPQLVETPPSTGTSSSSQEALIQAESSDDEDITEAKRLLQELQRQKVEAKEGRKKRELEAAAARKMQEELNRVAEINRLERERKATEEQLMRLTREEQDLVDAAAARTVKVKTRPQPELEGRSDSFPRSDRVKKVAPGGQCLCLWRIQAETEIMLLILIFPYSSYSTMGPQQLLCIL